MMLAAVCMSLTAAAQVTVFSGQVNDQYGAPLPGAQVRICNAATSTGTPCIPTVPIFQDYGLTIPVANSYTADQYGNYTVYAGPLASPNLYVVQLSPASGITWSYVVAGQVCGPMGCTFSGPVTATLFNATQFPYFEINGVQISSTALSDAANLAYLNAANLFTGSPQTAPIWNATTQFNVAGSQIASANLSDGANLAKLNASNTFTGATNTFAGIAGTTINATTGFQVGGVALAANNLSNGVSGTGAVCLASGSACAYSAPTLYYQTVQVGGTSQTQEPRLNLIAGANVTLTPVDVSGFSTSVTVAAVGGTSPNPNTPVLSGVCSGGAITMQTYSNDGEGSLTVTTGCSAGPIATLTFGGTYPRPMFCGLQGGNPAATPYLIYPNTPNATNLVISSSTGFPSGYFITWHCHE